MRRKNKLLSIGDLSKLTGASHRSLRYYEQLGLLEPVLIDPDSSYRYYSFDQVYLADMIQLCIELDVPLKVLKEYIDAKGMVVDMVALLAYARGAAMERKKRLETGMRFIDAMERQVLLAGQYQNSGMVYTRTMPEQILCLNPVARPFDEVDQLEMAKDFWKIGMGLGSEEQESWEFGLLCEYAPNAVSRYVFMELQAHTDKAKHIRTTPAGTYYCKQHDKSMIDQAPAVFEEQLRGKRSFLAIETEIFSGRHQISDPVKELRMIVV